MARSLMISLTNVTKTYGPIRALVGIHCVFNEGTITVLRGPNGSGKSTLLSIVGAMTRPTSGRIDHGPLGSKRSDIRAAIGWVGHESLCYPDLTGRENVELAASLHGCDLARAFALAADRFDLHAFANRPVRTYSRGQRQRIALARALVQTPRLLLLDEPTTGLDAAATARLEKVLRDEASAGATIVLSTHDEAFATAMGGASVRLERGRRTDPA
jgi:ABC-type multidrug transport system ATPase subunit